ncbi:MAG: NAD(P)/FAD-dependent oxidoreductase [Actinobacteria bacterium]|nr:NAD(P)/FAD-dependent oxidoreductase [Actinomycetota bacterium]
MIDIAIAGGGPAGLATAAEAALRGLTVVVLEPRRTPIAKACGEGLMPGAVRSLAELGVTPSGHAFHGIRYVRGSRFATAHFTHGSGLGVDRLELHRRLSARVLALGVEVRADAVDAVEQRTDRVIVNGLAARYLVVADGLHSPVRRLLGVETRPRRRGRRRWGLRRHVITPPWSDLVEVHWADRAEAYVTPVAPDVVNIAVLSGDRIGFDAQLEHFPQLRERLAGSHFDEVRGAGPLHCRVPRRVVGRALLVGDAAGYVDALTGEGLALAFRCARAAVDRIATGQPMRYEADYRQISRQYRLITSSLLWATRPRAVRERIVPVAIRLPSLFDAAVARLAGSALD